ncbi:MAG: hypothetical protein AMS25_11795 [Gemmatimonas sp. SM23_52]|nr:MAG: hypothetical protein AMS25_11795 [Gemmatimonas sp. SM23_52]
MRVLAHAARQDGFGIVSVLVAIVLLAIGVVALSSSSAFLVSLRTDAAARATAASIATSYMEEVKRRPPREVASEEPATVNETGREAEEGMFVRTLTVGPEPSVPDAARVTVSVQYPAGFGRRRTVELVTIIYQGP